MLIDCPVCARSYKVSRADIGEGGRNVICPRCEARWFVDADGTSSIIPPADAMRSCDHAYDVTDWATSRTTQVPFLQRALPAVAGLACVALAMGLLGAREHVVRLLPRTAGLYAGINLPVNVRGLDIVALAPTRMEGSPADITIAGEIRNVAHSRVGVPRLTYQVRDAAGATLVSWTEHASAKTLATGKTLPFVSSPRRLPAEAQSILVRFEDDDAVAPIRIARRMAN